MELFANINWLLFVPLGLAGAFFFVLGFRRISRYFYNDARNNRRERLRDLILSIPDIGAIIILMILLISPLEMWIIMVPCGLFVVLFSLPISILGTHLNYTISKEFIQTFLIKDESVFKLLKNQVQSSQTNVKKLSWYEYTPLAVIGGSIAFTISIIVGIAISSFNSRPPDMSMPTIVASIIVGIAVGVIIIVLAYLNQRQQ